MNAEERTNLAQWAEDARLRSLDKLFHVARKHCDAKQRLFDTEARMERAAEDYQRARLAGAHLPPISSNLVITNTPQPARQAR